MTPNERVVAAAFAMVGVPFRLHGRSVAHGVDCVGLVAACLDAAGVRPDLPNGYRLRGGDAAQAVRLAAALKLNACSGNRPGSIVAFLPGPRQLHLAIRVESGIVHADAGLRRVVLRPGRPDWPVIGAWTVER